uniref:Uncharacterized protein n=1 Tax=viral metagenome TaxID=1070528 RepID=A0A6C0EGH6_9ZZZZ
MANAWIEYIKKISKETGKSFKEAMSIASDRKKKGTKIECEVSSTEKKQRKTRRRKSGKKSRGTKKRRGSSKRR